MIRYDDHDAVPSRAKLLGTCATLSDRTGLDPTLLRVAGLVMALIAFKLTLILYCAAAVAFRLERR